MKWKFSGYPQDPEDITRILRISSIYFFLSPEKVILRILRISSRSWGYYQDSEDILNYFLFFSAEKVILRILRILRLKWRSWGYPQDPEDITRILKILNKFFCASWKSDPENITRILRISSIIFFVCWNSNPYHNPNQFFCRQKNKLRISSGSW